MKAKDLCLIPARVALAAQADGWWVRSDIIWSKPNPMPESVQDRPTDAYEHILMLTKSSKYYWDAEAVREKAIGVSDHDITGTGYSPPGQPPSNGNKLGREGVNSLMHQDRDPSHKETRKVRKPAGWDTAKRSHGSIHTDGRATEVEYTETTSATRNIRNVWTFATAPYKGAHFATFPPELVIRCLQAATKQGDLVLDPFGGSGTVGEVAFNMCRRFILCDLAYQDLQRERIPPMAFHLR